MTGLMNITEDIVEDKIHELWPGKNYCKCGECQKNIAIYALNRLPAHYVKSLEEKIICRLSSKEIQQDVDVTIVVNEAIEMVGKDPHPTAEKQHSTVV